MLFRFMNSSDSDLQSQREQIISDLNKMIAFVKIDVSIVFDSTFQLGGRSRSHFKDLEILFSAGGETADEYIIDELLHCKKPQQETIVTSDKKLAWFARRSHAHTESVEDFYAWLQKAYKNKLKKSKSPSNQTIFSQKSKIVPTPKAALGLPPTTQIILTPDSKVEESLKYYEQVFEGRYQELLKTEVNKKRKKVKKEKNTNLFQEVGKKHTEPHSTENLKALTQMERWLKAFENTSIDADGKTL